MELFLALLPGAIVYAVSLLYAAIGETFTERAGVMNLGVEGIMLMGAVSGALAATSTRSLGMSMLIVILVGLGLGLVFAFLTVTLQSDQTVCGMAMLILGTGLSGFLGADISAKPIELSFKNIAIPGLSEIPVLGNILFNQPLPVYIMYLIIPLATIYIYKTRWGLKLQALGENPAVLDAAGENVFAMRYGYIMFGCVMMAVSGAIISLGSTNVWQPEMTAGRGWIAFALVAFASWNPLKVAAGAMLFGVIYYLGPILQLYFPSIPSDVYSVLPYVVTIIVFILSTGNFRKRHTAEPAALTKPYDRESR